MEGPTRPQGDSAKEVEADYMQRIMRSLTDSSTSPAQSADQDSGMGSSSYSFIDSYGRIPDISAGLSPWEFVQPLPELRGPVTESSEGPGSWRNPNKDFDPIQREILTDFPWLKEELDASTSVVSKEKSDACLSVGPLAPSTEQVAWDQSMLELHAFDKSSSRLREVQPVSTRQQQSPVRFVDQALSTSLTPATSDTPFNSESLSSSLSDGEAELQDRTRKGSESGTEAAGTSAQSGKRQRPEEDGEDAPSDDQETSKKQISRPRKKAGVKRVREPRYAIKTRTETEVLDDGYKWRKYGQKAVKNSPHPRNYYRCTTVNCPVRKRVERCYDDPGLVVTTYEGTHTHQSPTFLRGPPGYPGGLQGLLVNLTHHYNLAGNTPLPPSYAVPMSNSDLYRSSSMSSAQPPIHENLNLLRAHEQFLRLQQQEAAWATSIKNEPPVGNFQFPGQGPRFSGVSSLSDLSFDTRMSSLANASMPGQLGHSQINPTEYSSLISNGPFNSVVGLSDRLAAAPSDSALLEDMLRDTNPSSSI